MSKMNFSSNRDKGTFNKFLSSKGFYVALAVCLVGASAATWVAVDRTINGIENSNDQLIQENGGFQEFPQYEEAETKRDDVPKSESSSQFSPPASSSQTESSSSEVSAEVSDESEPQTESPAASTLSYAFPVRGSITNQYSGGELVKNVTLGDWRTHDGVDIACEKGADIMAAADGTVVDVKNDSLWGTIVTISHPDGNETLYMGLDSNVLVEVGQSVSAKQVLGQLDGVPCEINDDSHLHYAMRSGGKFIDPMSVMTVSDS